MKEFREINFGIWEGLTNENIEINIVKKYFMDERT